MESVKLRITDIPYEELKKNMAAYGKKQAATVRSSRRYLRSVGLNINKDGSIN